AAVARRVTRGIGEAEVVRGDGAHVRSEPGDRGLHRGADQVPGQGHALGHNSSHFGTPIVEREALSWAAAARPLRTAPSIVPAQPATVCSGSAPAGISGAAFSCGTARTTASAVIDSPWAP